MTDEGAGEAAYDRFGEAYRDWMAPIVAPAAVRLLDALDRLTEPDQPARLLDVGTGTGTLALAALERWPAATATALDPSRLMLSLAADAAGRRGDGVSRRLDLVQGDAEALPLPPASVDVVFSSFVIQLVSSRAAALREMRRVLRPGGMLAVITWQQDEEPFEPDEMVWRTFDDLDVAVPEDDGRGTRAYSSPESAAAEVRRIGFREVRGRQEWIDHQFTPRSYLGIVENWMEDDLLAELDDEVRADFRARLLRRLDRLDREALRWRRPLVSVVGRRP